MAAFGFISGCATFYEAIADHRDSRAAFALVIPGLALAQQRLAVF